MAGEIWWARFVYFESFHTIFKKSFKERGFQREPINLSNFGFPLFKPSVKFDILLTKFDLLNFERLENRSHFCATTTCIFCQKMKVILLQSFLELILDSKIS